MPFCWFCHELAQFNEISEGLIRGIYYMSSLVSVVCIVQIRGVISNYCPLSYIFCCQRFFEGHMVTLVL